MLAAVVHEVVLYAEDGLQLWHARRAGYTIFDSYVGRVVLTSRRLMFLSTGDGGTGRRLAAAALGGPVGAFLFGETPTADLDLRALSSEGSVDIALDAIHDCVAHRRCDCATYVGVQYRKADAVAELAFMPKNSIAWAGAKAWEGEVQKARGAFAAGPFR